MESCVLGSAPPIPPLVPTHWLQPTVCYASELIDPWSASPKFMELREKERRPRKSSKGLTTAGSSRPLPGYALGPFGARALH